MKVLVHDYSGHPFQVQLSRELARRGHDVVHSWCDAYTSGKGKLAADPGESIRFEPIARGGSVEKMQFVVRLFQELRFGLELARQIGRTRPNVVMAANVPIPTLMIAALFMLVRRTPWVLWHQDVQAVAIESFAGGKLSRAFTIAAKVIGVGEKWCSRRAAAIVVITKAFLDVHRGWGTADKATVIPNWAPLDEIYPVERKNDWAVEHGVDDVQTLLYSGTLGLKHNPELLVQLARAVIDQGRPVRLVVVNEGPCEQLLRDEAERLDVPLTLLPFQPYDRLPEVLASGDILVVLLEADAGAFSVPSKTLSYLSAGRPVLGFMPGENLASELTVEGGGAVFEPHSRAIPEAAQWAVGMLADASSRCESGAQARALAEREFALEGCADRFERVLSRLPS